LTARSFTSGREPQGGYDPGADLSVVLDGEGLGGRERCDLTSLAGGGGLQAGDDTIGSREAALSGVR
jgi:hypothetical protein